MRKLDNLDVTAKLVLAVGAGAAIYLIAVPLAMLLFAAFRGPGDYLPFEPGAHWTLQHIRALFTDPVIYTRILPDTFIFVAGTVVVVFAIGFGLAWLIERTDLPGREIWFAFILFPLLVPTPVLAIAWIFLMGPNAGWLNLAIRATLGLDGPGPIDIFSMGGLILCQALASAPFVFLLLSATLRTMDPALEEASGTSGASASTTFCRVTLPVLLPGVLAPLILITLITAEQFELPLIIGLPAKINVFSYRIYFELNPLSGLPNYGAAAALSLPFVVLGVLLLLLYNRLIKRADSFVTMTGRGYRQRRLPLGAWRIPALALATLYVALAAVLPAAVLLWTSFFAYALPLSATAADFSLEAYRQLFVNRAFWLGLRNTFLVALASALIVTAIGALLGWIISRSQLRFRHVLDFVSVLSVGIPAVIAALGVMPLSVAADRSLWVGWDSDHRLFLSLRHHHAPCTRGLFADSQGARRGFRRLGRALDRDAAACADPPHAAGAFRWVYSPLHRRRARVHHAARALQPGQRGSVGAAVAVVPIRPAGAVCRTCVDHRRGGVAGHFRCAPNAGTPHARGMTMLTVKGLAKSFLAVEGAVRAVDGVTFCVAPGQCYALLGPSGCGKTTILRCVAGLERADAGSIAIGGRLVSDEDSFVPVHERPIGIVFQSYAIWPHLDVFDNVAYPLEVERPRIARAEIEKRVADVLALVGLQTMARRPATRLSGGQQQRVALARAIVRRPSLLLLDEPLSNLDARLRDSMRRELSTLIRQIGVTALFVTHDQVEALSLADRVAVMDQGRIVQEGAPADIYERPKSLFVARFLGAANVLAGRVEERDCQGRVRIALDGGGHRLTLVAQHRPGARVDVVLRPEDLMLSALAPADERNAISGRIVALAFQGSSVEYEVDVGGSALLRVLARPQADLRPGTPVWIGIDARRVAIFGSAEGSVADSV